MTTQMSANNGTALEGEREGATSKAIEDRLAQWGNLVEQAKEQIGPLRGQHSGKEHSPAAHGEPAAPLSPEDKQARVKKLVSRLAPGAERQNDGARTTVIMAQALLEALSATEAGPTKLVLQKSLPELKRIGEQIGGLLKGHKPPPQRHQRRLRSTTNLETWLMDQPYERAEARQPMAFREQGTEYRLEQMHGFWLAGGLRALLYDNAVGHDAHWETQRLQLTVVEPYVLVYDGVLRGEGCGEALREVIDPTNGPEPVVLLIARGVGRDAVFSGRYHTIVLPAPASDSPITLGHLAHAFDTHVLSGQADQINWRAAAQQLGLCRVAQIDRERAILLPPKGVATASAPAAPPKVGWGVCSFNALIMPPTDASNHTPTIAEGEALLRARIEAEAGVIAGAGAGFYWLAEQIDAQEGTPAAWLQQALRAPMLQLLKASGVSEDTPEGLLKTVRHWVSSDDKPSRTFLIEKRAVAATLGIDQSRVQKIDTSNVLILGEAEELGIYTPVDQIIRMIDEAYKLALSIASLNDFNPKQ